METKYTCECCHESFEPGWSEEEAVKEKNDLFPTVSIDDCSKVCDSCFHEIMAFAKENGLKEHAEENDLGIS